MPNKKEFDCQLIIDKKPAQDNRIVIYIADNIARLAVAELWFTSVDFTNLLLGFARPYRSCSLNFRNTYDFHGCFYEETFIEIPANIFEENFAFTLENRDKICKAVQPELNNGWVIYFPKLRLNGLRSVIIGDYAHIPMFRFIGAPVQNTTLKLYQSKSVENLAIHLDDEPLLKGEKMLSLRVISQEGNRVLMLGFELKALTEALFTDKWVSGKMILYDVYSTLEGEIMEYADMGIF